MKLNVESKYPRFPVLLCEVFLRAINHTLVLLTGHALDWFIPAWVRATEDRNAFKGRDSLDLEIDPVRDWRILRFVCDEDGAQNRAMHFLFSYVGLRGAVSPEISHPKWNSFKRACSSAGLQYDLLRLSVAANFSHGTKITGERARDRRAYLERYMEKQSCQYFLDLRDEMLLDRGLESSSMDVELDAKAVTEEALSCPSIRRKGIYEPRL